MAPARARRHTARHLNSGLFSRKLPLGTMLLCSAHVDALQPLTSVPHFSHTLQPAVGRAASGDSLLMALNASQRLLRRRPRIPRDILLARRDRVRVYYNDQDESPLAARLAEMMKVAPGLRQPSYRPTPWVARASKANFALATLRSRMGVLRQAVEPPLSGRFSPTADPDVVVEWSKDPLAYALPPDAPIVAFCHTITGSAAQTRWLMKYASQRGWRPCTFVRRGHGGPLHAPSFDLLGAVEDVKLQSAAAREAFPRSAFLALVGVSAGSAQVISDLGRHGETTPVGAAAAICPAWHVPTAFGSLGTTQPLAEKAMLRSAKATFLAKNEEILRGANPAAYDRCLEARSLPELMDAHAPFAMRDPSATAESYYAAHDPMADRHGVAVPTLLLNAADDFVCPVALARPDVIVEEQPGALLLVTRSGSHVAFNEGWLARGSFHMRIAFDFFDAAFATRPQQGPEQTGVVVPVRRIPGQMPPPGERPTMRVLNGRS